MRRIALAALLMGLASAAAAQPTAPLSAAAQAQGAAIRPTPYSGPSPPGQYITYQQRAGLFGAGEAPVEPFRVVGDIYYVGAADLASYLIKTPQGHILIDTGTTLMGGDILRNIEKLGLKPTDVKVILNTHAHVDHIQSMAFVKRATGGAVMIMDADAPAAASGKDLSPIHADGWEPIEIDRILHDNDEVSLGGVTLRAILTPGHTPGTTAWVVTTREGDRAYQVLFGMAPVAIVGDPVYDSKPEAMATAYRRLGELKPDIVLYGHVSAAWKDRFDALRAGQRPHPLLMPAGAFAKSLAEGEADFKKRYAAAHPGAASGR